MKAYTEEMKEKVLEEYYACEKPVKEICAEYGCQMRTLYAWVEKSRGTMNGRVKRPKRRGIYMTAEEIELVLLMIIECESIFNDKQRVKMRVLEDRLLDAADELTEIMFAENKSIKYPNKY